MKFCTKKLTIQNNHYKIWGPICYTWSIMSLYYASPWKCNETKGFCWCNLLCLFSALGYFCTPSQIGIGMLSVHKMWNYWQKHSFMSNRTFMLYKSFKWYSCLDVIKTNHIFKNTNQYLQDTWFSDVMDQSYSLVWE